MKTVKALKDYIFSPYSRNKGETVTVPDAIGARLVRIGFAEYVEEDLIEEDLIEEEPVEDPGDRVSEKPAEKPAEDPGDQVSEKPEKTANRSARKRAVVKK